MSSRFSLLLLLPCLFAGCCYNDPSIDLLEGELRWMEDQIYMLEDELGDACAELCECRESLPLAPQRLRQPTSAQSTGPQADFDRRDEPENGDPELDAEGDLPSPYSPPVIEFPSDDSRSSSSLDEDTLIESPDVEELPRTLAPPPRIELPETNESDSLMQEVPDLEPQPVPALPRPETRPQLDNPNRGDDTDETSATDERDPESHEFNIRLQSHEQAAKSPDVGPRTGVDAHITHIVASVRPQRRGHSDSRPDFVVVLQPRNADGEYVALPSDVSVVVLDRAEIGEAQRVARWDFSAAETARMIHPEAAERGIRLEFDWPVELSADDLYRSRGLHIFIRYVTVDGRKLQTDQPLEVGDQYDGAISRTSAAEWVADHSDSSTGWTVVSAPPDTRNSPDRNGLHSAGVNSVTIESPNSSGWSIVPYADSEPEEPKPLQLPPGQLGSVMELPSRLASTGSQTESADTDGEGQPDRSAVLPVLRPQEKVTRPSWSPHR